MTEKSLTVRLDHWASLLRNTPEPLDDDETMELSTLLTEAANALAAGRLTDSLRLYEAHTENLIERMARVERHLWPAEWTDD